MVNIRLLARLELAMVMVELEPLAVFQVQFWPEEIEAAPFWLITGLGPVAVAVDILMLFKWLNEEGELKRNRTGGYPIKIVIW